MSKYIVNLPSAGVVGWGFCGRFLQWDFGLLGAAWLGRNFSPIICANARPTRIRMANFTCCRLRRAWLIDRRCLHTDEIDGSCMTMFSRRKSIQWHIFHHHLLLVFLDCCHSDEPWLKMCCSVCVCVSLNSLSTISTFAHRRLLLLVSSYFSFAVFFLFLYIKYSKTHDFSRNDIGRSGKKVFFPNRRETQREREKRSQMRDGSERDKEEKKPTIQLIIANRTGWQRSEKEKRIWTREREEENESYCW